VIKAVFRAALGAAVTFVLLSCDYGARQAVDPVTGATVNAPEPTNRMARKSNVKIDDLYIGYKSYLQHCARCHQDRVPKRPIGQRYWHPESMGLNLYSSLSDHQRYGVIEYLKAVERARFKLEFDSIQDIR
jgi:hypothetical protein